MGAAGFIGTNLIEMLSKNPENTIIAVDSELAFFSESVLGKTNIICKGIPYNKNADFDGVLENADVLFHLASTDIPGDSNSFIVSSIESNVVTSAILLDACVSNKVKKVVFISSGGAVYGKEAVCPISEEQEPTPISAYGIQKYTIEKLLYLYKYKYDLNYKIIRLANPYGRYQRPDGRLGVISTFTYHALTDRIINIYGDGTVIRDYIYIDDAIKAIINIAFIESKYSIYNVGSGVGISVNEVISTICNITKINLVINCTSARDADVPVNYLDVSRYEECFGKLSTVPLREGICKLISYMREDFNIK